MSESGASKDVKFPLKLTVNKQKTKVLFAEVDSSFADVLLSFLTLPLGTIVRILENHYKDYAPAFGSLTTLYKALSNLDSAKFWTEGAKSILLHPRSTFDARREGLKLDISDSPTLEYFVCNYCSSKFESLSMYYDNFSWCPFCRIFGGIRKETKKDAQTCGEGFTTSTISFLITDNMQIIPNLGLLQIGNFLGTSDMDNAELLNATLGFAEVMDLLKASLVSDTPLSDVILKTRSHTNSPPKKFDFSGNASTPDSKKLNLKLVVQKSTNKLVHAEAEEDFVEFLFGLLIIPLGQVESLLKNNSGIKAIDNLHKSVADHMKDKYLNDLGAKASLLEPKIPHGYSSKSNVLPYTEACLSDSNYKNLDSRCGPSIKFPKGQGNYLVDPHIYKVEDDLTVNPFCVSSILSSLKKLKISMSDVKEVQLQIGLEEGLRILKASLTSTSALTDALLLDRVANKQPKQEL